VNLEQNYINTNIKNIVQLVQKKWVIVDVKKNKLISLIIINN
jgi:hypothetical protein